MLQLYRLTNTDIVSLQEEKAELEKRVQRLNEILESDDVLRQVIIKRLKEIKQKYPDIQAQSLSCQDISLIQLLI